MNDKFFKLPSVPGVMFLKGSSFDDCKKINANLSLKEFNKATGVKEIKVKKEKVKLSDKRDKRKLEDKSL